MLVKSYKTSGSATSELVVQKEEYAYAQYPAAFFASYYYRKNFDLSAFLLTESDAANGGAGAPNEHSRERLRQCDAVRDGAVRAATDGQTLDSVVKLLEVDLNLDQKPLRLCR